MKNSSNASNCSLGAFKLATHQPRKLRTGEAAAPRRLGRHTPPRGAPPQPRDGELSAAGREAAKATAAPPLPVTRKPLNRRPSGERLACTTRMSTRAWPALAPRFCASGICTQPPLSICRVRVWLQTLWCRKLARARSFTDAKRRGVKAAAAQMEAAAPPEQPLLNARAASAGARWREFPPLCRAVPLAPSTCHRGTLRRCGSAG